MVNPVTDPRAKTRSVYLPKGNGWVDFWTGKRYAGGETIDTPTPINEMPLFVKAGAIIPFGPDLQYATEKKADPLELRIYTGADGSFNLYEDENDNNDYKKGVFSTIPFSWSGARKTLTIGERKGTFPGMLEERTINVIFVDATHGTGSLVSAKIDKTVKYNGNSITIKK